MTAERAELGGLELRRALGLFATGVTVVTAIDPVSGEPRGMTANAFMSGSLRPPLILVSVKLNARLHSMLDSTGQFGVSVLPESLEREARRFAGLPLDPPGSGPHFGWSGGVPVLEHAMAWFTSEVVDRHRTGDHTLFVGQVRDFRVVDAHAAPLVFHRSQFAHLVTESEGRQLATDPWGGVLDLWG